jgi:predicted KAP-like P-loop ATPase
VRKKVVIRSEIRKIRVKKEDSAFVYFILESYEGVTSYSTLDFEPGDAHRDLELRTTSDFSKEVDDLLKRLGELVYELA